MPELLKWNFPIASREENMLWRSVAIYQDNINIPLERFKQLNKENIIVKPERFLNASAYYGNFKLVCYLLDVNGEFKLTPSIYTLNAAAKSGNLDLLKYLLEPTNHFGLLPVESTLDAAKESRNSKLIDYISKPEFELNIFRERKMNI